jgi:release factor glutamine methyltransferase
MKVTSREAMTTLANLRRQILTELTALGIDSGEARRESELIIEHVTGCDTAQQILKSQDELSPSETEQLHGILAQRKERVPLQYCLGHTWFMGLRFDVAPGIFIPRADTETVVAACVAMINRQPRQDLKIAEVGIGSGAIAVSLLKLFPNCRVVACDISPHAVAMADNNARLNGVRDRLSIDCADWHRVLPNDVDCVVSNPPYIPAELAATLAPEVVAHEPGEALFGTDEDGLGFYRDFARVIPQHFAGGHGFVVLEVGADQSAAVCEIFLKHDWKDIQICLDMSGLARVVTAAK